MKISTYIYPIGKFLAATVVVPVSSLKYWLSRCFKKTKKETWDEDLIAEECYGIAHDFTLESAVIAGSNVGIAGGGFLLSIPTLATQIIGGFFLSASSLVYAYKLISILKRENFWNFYLDQIDFMQWININSKNRACGNTRLHIALLEQNIFVVQSLLNQKVELVIKNHYGLTALDIIHSFSTRVYPIKRSAESLYYYKDKEALEKSEKEGYVFEENFSQRLPSLLQRPEINYCIQEELKQKLELVLNSLSGTMPDVIDDTSVTVRNQFKRQALPIIKEYLYVLPPVGQWLGANPIQPSMRDMTEKFSISDYPIARFILAGITFPVIMMYFLPKTITIYCNRRPKIQLCNMNRDSVDQQMKQMHGLNLSIVTLPYHIIVVIGSSSLILVGKILEMSQFSYPGIGLLIANSLSLAILSLAKSYFGNLWDGLKFDIDSYFNINQKNKYGNTLLHMAIHKCDISKVQKLHSKGASLAVLSDANEELQQTNSTPIDLALRNLELANLFPLHHSSVKISIASQQIVSFLYPFVARNYKKNREEYIKMLSQCLSDSDKSVFPIDISRLIFSYLRNKIKFDYTYNEILQKRIIRNSDVEEDLTRSILPKYHMLCKVNTKEFPVSQNNRLLPDQFTNLQTIQRPAQPEPKNKKDCVITISAMK